MTSYAMIAAIDKLTRMREHVDGDIAIRWPRAGGQWHVLMALGSGTQKLYTGASLPECVDKLEYDNMWLVQRSDVHE